MLLRSEKSPRDLPRAAAAPIAHPSGLFLKSQRNFPSKCRAAAVRILEAI